MSIKIIAIIVLTTALCACQSYTVPPYTASTDTVHLVKNLKIKDAVAVGSISAPPNIDLNCRAMGPITFPNGRTLTEYVKKALEDELKLADAFAYQNPKLILSGEITKFEMSSTKGLLKGFFNIELKLRSNNGKSLQASEYYEFASGLDGYTACKNTTDALMPAIQNLINKLYANPRFIDLVRPTPYSANAKNKSKQSLLPPLTPAQSSQNAKMALPEPLINKQINDQTLPALSPK